MHVNKLVALLVLLLASVAGAVAPATADRAIGKIYDLTGATFLQMSTSSVTLDTGANDVKIEVSGANTLSVPNLNVATGLTVNGTSITGAGGFTVGLPPSAGTGLVGATNIPAFQIMANSGAPALAFDGSTDEAIAWIFTLPNSYQSGSDVIFELVVSSASTSQDVTWDLRVGTMEGEDLDTTAPGTFLDTAISVNATTSVTAGVATTVQGFSLSNGQIDNAAAGDMVMVYLNRDASADASTVDVFVHQVRVYQ